MKKCKLGIGIIGNPFSCSNSTTGGCTVCPHWIEEESEHILTVNHDKEVNVFVSRFQLPLLYSQGKTKQEALDAIESAVKLWIKTFFEAKK